MAYEFKYTLKADTLITKLSSAVPEEVMNLYNSFVAEGRILYDTYEEDLLDPRVSHHSIVFATEQDKIDYFAQLTPPIFANGYSVDTTTNSEGEIDI